MNYNYFPTLVIGDYCTFFIGDDFSVYTLGKNQYGKLGFDSLRFTLISSPQKIPLLTNIKMVRCGMNYTVCLTYNGEVYSFGSNSSAQLGVGKTNFELSSSHNPLLVTLPFINYIACGFTHTMCIDNEGNVYCFGTENAHKYINPTQILQLSDIIFIECGGNYTICIDTNNMYYVFGSNTKGQLGLGHNSAVTKPTKSENWPNNIKSIRCGDNHTLLLTDSGKIYSFGDNSWLQLGIPKDISFISSPRLIDDIPEMQRIECGYNHSMCIDYDNNLWLFGANYCGQLGTEDTTNKEPFKQTKFGKVVDLSYKGAKIFVKTDENKILACGKNNSCELGLPQSIKDCHSPTQTLINNEYMWNSMYGKSRAKSARK